MASACSSPICRLSDTPVVHHQEKLDELRAGWIYTVPVEWPADSGGRLAATVREMVADLAAGN